MSKMSTVQLLQAGGGASNKYGQTEKHTSGWYFKDTNNAKARKAKLTVRTSDHSTFGAALCMIGFFLRWGFGSQFCGAETDHYHRVCFT